MSNLFYDKICDSLDQFANIEEQKRLWLSNGKDGAEVSSLTEAIEQLYTDTGLGDALDRGATGLDESTVALLLLLRRRALEIDRRHGPQRTIEDPQMNEVRSIAKQIIGKFRDEEKGDKF